MSEKRDREVRDLTRFESMSTEELQEILRMDAQKPVSEESDTKEISTSRMDSLILLTFAYGTGVGGMASPLGGAMNLVTVDYLEQVAGQKIMYVAWMVRFLPIMEILLASNVLMLLIGVKRRAAERFQGVFFHAV